MPMQVWIQTQKNNVQSVKLILEEAGQLSKIEKVKNGGQDGYMIIPTKKYHDEEVTDDNGNLQILSDLHLYGISQNTLAEIVFLPTTQPSSTVTNRFKLGPIQIAISEWLQSLPDPPIRKSSTTRKDLLEASPRRWSIYEPMLLLPPSSFQSSQWKAHLISLDATHLSSLWTLILHNVWKIEGGKRLTHLAVNSGIPSSQISASNDEHLEKTANPTSSPFNGATPSSSVKPNILRTPSGLLILFGDFGPPCAHAPSATDFHRAFWVSSMQNGIIQTWAPRYTMFSRGNIKEKARLLKYHNAETATTTDARRGVGREERRAGAVVDLYAGIGYFAFSYVAAGFGSVFCWELNPWSVEGLRRGAERNGWSVRVVKGRGLESRVGENVLGEEEGEKRLVVFEEGNEHAVERMQEMRRRGMLGDVVHMNCGLLPSSRSSWRAAWEMVVAVEVRRVWLHLHENVGVEDVEKRREEIEAIFGSWAKEEGYLRIVEVEHVELVKTFAPGVWHCVFDVLVQPGKNV